MQKIEKKSTNIPTVGILIPDIRSGYAPILARGAEDEATKNNVSLILCNTDDMLSQAGYHIERLIKLNVSGIIYIPVAASEFDPKRLTMAISARPITTRLRLLKIIGIARIIICLEILLGE